MHLASPHQSARVVKAGGDHGKGCGCKNGRRLRKSDVHLSADTESPLEVVSPAVGRVGDGHSTSVPSAGAEGREEETAHDSGRRVVRELVGGADPQLTRTVVAPAI